MPNEHIRISAAMTPGERILDLIGDFSREIGAPNLCYSAAHSVGRFEIYLTATYPNGIKHMTFAIGYIEAMKPLKKDLILEQLKKAWAEAIIEPFVLPPHISDTV